MIKDIFFFQDFAYDDIQTNTLGSLLPLPEETLLVAQNEDYS